jgi:hypothetical protein
MDSALFSLAPAIQLLRPRTDLSIVVVVTRTTRDYYYIIFSTDGCDDNPAC